MKNKERQGKELITNIAPETVFWTAIAVASRILLITGFLYS